jgi:outer membrane protein assembly factor BamB
LTCLDYRTGKPLWSRSVGSASSVSGAVGQRSDDVFVVPTSGQARVEALDGATGRPRFSEAVPSGSRLVAAGHTVGYALSYGITGAQSNVTALDLATGRRLWSHSSEVQLSIWGGHLIDVGMDGLARRLVS